jgi:hypothetical protein
MENDARATLPFRGGHVALTDTHLIVVRGDYMTDFLALRHIAEPATMESHSCGHRFWAIVAGAVLLTPAIGMCLPGDIAGRFELLGQIRGKLGFLLPFAILFMALFGLVFLWGAVASRRIWWLTLRYGTTMKHIPLAGAEPNEVERFLGLIVQEIENTA